MSKSFILLFITFLVFSFSYAQNPLLEKKNYKNAQIKIMKIDNFQTEDYLQTKDNTYINDFLILESYDTNRKLKKEIVKLLLESSTYLDNTNRSCPFIANFAIEIKSKNARLEVIIARSACPKILVKDTYSEAVFSFDLTKDSDIYNLIDEFFLTEK